jgi:hypothetical protein
MSSLIGTTTGPQHINRNIASWQTHHMDKTTMMSNIAEASKSADHPTKTLSSPVQRGPCCHRRWATEHRHYTRSGINVLWLSCKRPVVKRDRTFWAERAKMSYCHTGGFTAPIVSASMCFSSFPVSSRAGFSPPATIVSTTCDTNSETDTSDANIDANIDDTSLNVESPVHGQFSMKFSAGAPTPGAPGAGAPGAGARSCQTHSRHFNYVP